MNCFEWQSRASDFLDGDLPEPFRREADDHVASCKECSARSKHYRQILSSIAGQPRLPLPPAIRKAPLAVIPRLDSHSSRSRWEHVPWYVRTPLEGMGIVLLILLGISTGPRIRSLYENSIRRGLHEFTDSLSYSDLAFTLSKRADDVPPLESGAPSSEKTDEISGEDEEDSEAETPQLSKDGKPLQVGKSEMWRIVLKTDSPQDMRPRVIQAMRDLKIPQETPGLGGLRAPGVITFDIEVPSTLVLDVRREIEKLGAKLTADEDSTSKTFTWYKVKSRRRIPDGKTRVVIILQQI